MYISVEDENKLEIVKDFSPRELRIVLRFYKDGMFYDGNGQPYTREHMMDIINRFGVSNANY